MNHRDRITALMTERRWTIDRAAVELNTDTPTLRFFLAGYKAESRAQQIRLDDVVSRFAALEAVGPPDDTTHPTPMRRRPTDKQRGADPYCKNGHLFVSGSFYRTKNGTRRCIECEQARKERRHTATRAALSALGTLNARGLRDVEIANLIGMGSSVISAYKCGDAMPSDKRIDDLQSLVAVTNDLTGQERKGGQMYQPHPRIDEIRARLVSVGEREVAA